MRKAISRTAACILAVLLLAGLGIGAAADFSYEEINVEIPVGGTGNFCLIPADADDADVIAKIKAEGYGVFTQSFVEPDDYAYVIYSPDANNKARYDVLIRVLTDESDALTANVVVTDSETGRKVPSALYPITVVDPPVIKVVTGDTPPSSERFEFFFRAVDTSVESLKGSLPMPEGSDGQTKRLSVVGSGETEAGIIRFDRGGTYTYEFTEVNTGTAGYTYDKTVYRVVFDVKETEKGLVAEQTITKDGVVTNDYSARFVNSYKKTSNGPKTGDTNNPQLWVVLMFMSFALLCASSWRLKKYR